MKITKTLKWFEGYLPTRRHRKLRYRETSGEFSAEIPELSEADAPIAIVMPRRNQFDGDSNFGTRRVLEYRWCQDHLYAPVRRSYFRSLCEGERQRAAKLSDIYLWPKVYNSEEEAQNAIEQLYEDFALINGRLHCEIGEPRYVVMTLGLGGNHGLGWGTSISVDHWYNSNIHRDRYFRIDQEELARKTGRKIAEDRGDTKAFPHFDRRMYERFQIRIPDAIRLNPQAEHGEGDPFINQVDALTRAKDPVVAGLGMMALAFRQN